jgi:hypothetical protein
MTLLENGRFVIAHVRGLGTSDIGVDKSVVQADVFEPNGTSANIPFLATSEEEIKCSSPTLAPLPGGRFLLAWVQKRADTFDTTPSVRAKVFDANLGDSVGQEVQVNTTMTGNRDTSVFSACAATLVSPGEFEAAFVAWADDSQTGGDTSDFAVRGRMLPVLASDGLG